MPETCLSLRHSLSNSSKDAASLVNSSTTSFCIKPAALDVARGSHSRPSPSPAWPTVSNAYPLVVIMSKKCKVSLLSCCGPTVKPTFMTEVSDAAEFFMAFVKFLSNCPM